MSSAMVAAAIDKCLRKRCCGSISVCEAGSHVQLAESRCELARCDVIQLTKKAVFSHARLRAPRKHRSMVLPGRGQLAQRPVRAPSRGMVLVVSAGDLGGVRKILASRVFCAEHTHSQLCPQPPFRLVPWLSKHQSYERKAIGLAVLVGRKPSEHLQCHHRQGQIYEGRSRRPKPSVKTRGYSCQHTCMQPFLFLTACAVICVKTISHLQVI